MPRTSHELRKGPLDGAGNPAAPALLLLVLLLAIDLVFVVADVVLNIIGIAPSPDLHLGRDRGHPEYFQYTKFIWMLLMLPLLAWRYRAWVLLGWVPVFAYLLIDDSFTVHEAYGNRIATALEIPPRWGLRPIDFGELIVSAVAALTLVLLLGACYAAARRTVRRIFRDLLVLIALMAFFGVVVDMLHMLTSGIMWDVVGILEDGGEMVAVSLMVAYVFHAVLSPAPPDLVGSVRRRRSARS